MNTLHHVIVNNMRYTRNEHYENVTSTRQLQWLMDCGYQLNSAINSA